MITIGHKYKVEADNMNIILSKKVRRTRKDTQEKYTDWEVEGYFSTPVGAIHALVNQGVKDTQLKDLKTVVDKMEELHTLIDSLSINKIEEEVNGTITKVQG